MLRKLFQNEDGSLSIEFIGLFPFFLILILVFFQILGSGYSLLLAQKAVHESAKVYSLTESKQQASEMVDNVIGASSILAHENFKVHERGDGYFAVEFTGRHGIVFGPDSWKQMINLPHKTYGKVIE